MPIDYDEELHLLTIPYDEGVLHFQDMAGITHHYKTTHIEFHTPAEHSLDGCEPDLEMQIVHEKQNSDQLAVVSVLFALVDDLESPTAWRRNLGTPTTSGSVTTASPTGSTSIPDYIAPVPAPATTTTTRPFT